MRDELSNSDKRHNKDFDNLKSSLKKSGVNFKNKKNRVVFDESANEFFEADYIIVVRDECEYSDGEECTSCEPLSPPEGYKDGGSGLFNRDGTLKETAWYASGGVALLVGEKSGTVFTPHHLQLLRQLQHERMLRASLCPDCHQNHHNEHDIIYDEDDCSSDIESNSSGDPGKLQRVGSKKGKHISAGEERPKTNSNQQTTPTDDLSCDKYKPCTLVQNNIDTSFRVNQNVLHYLPSEESDANDTENDSRKSDSSPERSRRAGILKGGKLWKISTENERPDSVCDQADDQRSTTASDEESSMLRSVRFYDEKKMSDRDAGDGETDSGNGTELSQRFSEPELIQQQSTPIRLESPLILSSNINTNKTNSAVRQLFSSRRPPPPAIEPLPLTSESLRTLEPEKRFPRTEEAAIRRVAERNALRCTLLRNEVKKKTQTKPETTSLAERIRLLTCDIDDETSENKNHSKEDKELVDEKAKTHEKMHRPDIAETTHYEVQKPKSETCRHLLSTFSQLTACVGSTGGHDPFYYQLASDNTTSVEKSEGFTDAPAPDVLAGTPGAHDDDGLASFVMASSLRTDRLTQKYGKNDSDDDEHDDYGFNRRPTVCGVKSQSNNDMLKEMQSQLQSNLGSSTQQISTHVPTPNNMNPCLQPATTYAWNYYHDSNPSGHNSQFRNKTNQHWSNNEYVQIQRSCSVNSAHSSQSEGCSYSQGHVCNMTIPNTEHKNTYSIYANLRCDDMSQDIYGSQTSSEQTSPIRIISRQCRRPESPPPIKNYHQLYYIPYNNAHMTNQYHQDVMQWNSAEYSPSMTSYYQQSSSSGTSTPQQVPVNQPLIADQRIPYCQSLPLQMYMDRSNICNPVAPVKYKTVTSHSGHTQTGQHMISYSEKVQPPMYQKASSAPPGNMTRGVPEGASSSHSTYRASIQSASSPLSGSQSNNPIYYAMNV